MKKPNKYTPKRDPLSNRKKTGSFENDRSRRFRTPLKPLHTTPHNPPFQQAPRRGNNQKPIRRDIDAKLLT